MRPPLSTGQTTPACPNPPSRPDGWDNAPTTSLSPPQPLFPPAVPLHERPGAR
ncbi:hypothetical protein FRC12_013442 [Ceratobasidium sp. 428]|nr:hypothetical protein FRC12_013442 [Ceratobasidium sp. 428]